AHQPGPNSDDKKPADKSSPAQQIQDEKKQPRLDRFGDPLPADAVARLGTIRLRNGGSVNRVAYSPDAKLLASAAGWDNTIRVWETEGYKEVYRCVGHTGGAHSVVFSPNGKKLASSGADKTIRIWDATTGKEVKQWQCSEWIGALNYSPDGK